MNRRGIIAGIFAALGLRAQAPQGARDGDYTIDGESYKALRPWSERKPRNGQCPVCGTMAKPYHDSDPNSRVCTDGMDQRGAYKKCPPSQNCTRCARCSAAFWQDAE